MIITYIPMYCGGRFLAGFHDPQAHFVPGHVYKTSLEGWGGPASRYDVLDKCPYLPNDFVEFLQILRKFLYADKGREGFQGVVYAVTNPQQTRAPKYLKDAGFAEAGSFKKGNGQNTCVTWLGDYRNKIYPILEKVPDWKAENVASKFTKPETAQFSIPQPVPQPMQNPFRDIAQQTLSSADAREDTIRPR